MTSVSISNTSASIDALGHRTTYSYDALDRQTQVQDALGDLSTTLYDAAGNVTTSIDQLGHRIPFGRGSRGADEDSSFLSSPISFPV